MTISDTSAAVTVAVAGGAQVSVHIRNSAGSDAALASDVGGTPVTWPVTISADTTYYGPPGQYSVSVQALGVELATASTEARPVSHTTGAPQIVQTSRRTGTTVSAHFENLTAAIPSLFGVGGFPALPGSDGTYTLTLTVTSGVGVLSWVGA